MPKLANTNDETQASERLFRRPWRFIKSVPSLEFLPDEGWPEVAFAGRSNVGKSSLINALVGIKGLARTSNTPGRTQELNFFAPSDADFYLVDMPGYGFAQAPKKTVKAWTSLVRDYLQGRTVLQRVFLLIDARHGIKPPDREIMALMSEAAVSFQAVLTKADKLKPEAISKVSRDVELALVKQGAAHPLVLSTSAVAGLGLDALRNEIACFACPRS